MKNFEDMTVIDMAEGIQHMTRNRIEFDRALWIATAMKQQDEGTYKPEEWMYSKELGFSILKAEAYRLKR
jgi:hypothetical protein